MIDRRDFLRTLALTGGGLGLGAGWPGIRPLDAATPGASGPNAPLRILILGGTGFIGPHQVHIALERGHEVTIFNRGRTDPQLHQGDFDRVEWLIGDREDDLTALEGDRRWDAVVDNSAMTPDWVRDTAGMLKDRADRYLFVSTESVYVADGRPRLDEDSPVGQPGVPRDEWEGYGPLKALAEEETRRAFGDRAVIVRPGLIVGPGDRTDRFTYWPVRVAEGGEVLAPGRPDGPVQFIDARDLTGWMIHLLETGTTGTFNGVGPEEPLTWGRFLPAVRDAVSSDATFTWVDGDFLLERGVQPWSDVPVWFGHRGPMAGFARVSNARALAAGLTCRPVEVTAADTLTWFRSLPETRRSDFRAGMSRAREAELLAAWHAREGAS